MIGRNEAQKRIIDALREIEIRAMPSVPLPDAAPGIALGMRATEAQRFVEALVPAGRLDRDDDLVRHMFGHGAELTADEEPWSWEGGLMLNDERLEVFGAHPLELRFTIGIPDGDLPEVMQRLGVVST